MHLPVRARPLQIEKVQALTSQRMEEVNRAVGLSLAV